MSYQTGALDLTLLNGEQVDQSRMTRVHQRGRRLSVVHQPNIDGVPELANENLRKAMTFALDRRRHYRRCPEGRLCPLLHRSASSVRHRPGRQRFQRRPDQVRRLLRIRYHQAAEYYETAKSELGKDSFTFDMIVDADDAPQKVAQVVKEQLETTLPGFTLNLTVEPKKQRVQDMQDGKLRGRPHPLGTRLRRTP